MQKKQTITILHQTHYHFDRLTTIMPHVLRLRPAPHCRVPIQSYSLKIKPEDYQIHWQQDPYANYLTRLFFPNMTSSLLFDVSITADILEINPFNFFLDDSAHSFPFNYEKQLKEGLYPYLQIKEKGPKLINWINKIDTSPQATIDFLVSVNKQLHQDLKYLKRFEPGVQSCEETLTTKVGSCRDSAWLLIQIFRHMGLAARFVSGYQVQLDIESTDGEKTDITDLHAWAEVYIPGAGWIGLDPNTGLFATGSYIPLACTPDTDSAAPITGSTTPCEVTFEYATKIFRS